MVKCSCCWEEIKTTVEIKEELHQRLEQALEDLQRLKHHDELAELQEEEDFTFAVPYLEELLKEFQERLWKIKLEGIVRLLMTSEGEAGIALSYDELGHSFQFHLGRQTIAFSPFITHEENDWVGEYKIDWENLWTVTSPGSPLYEGAFRLFEKKTFPIGVLFEDLRRFLEVCYEIGKEDFEGSHKDFLRELLKKIDQKEEGSS